MQTLPASLQARIAEHQYRSVLHRNAHLFGATSSQFWERFLSALSPRWVMPRETVLKAGEISREVRLHSDKCAVLHLFEKGVCLQRARRARMLSRLSVWFQTVGHTLFNWFDVLAVQCTIALERTSPLTPLCALCSWRSCSMVQWRRLTRVEL